MTENTTGKISRGSVEQVLFELTGFKSDNAEVARALRIIDGYVIDMADSLGVAPTPVIESYLHLLYQQSELLLDSRGGYAALRDAVDDLSERVTQLAATVLDSQTRMRPARVELTDAERSIVRSTLDAEVREIEAQEIPQWERELLEEQARRQDAEMDQVISDATDEVLGVRVAGEGDEVYCRTCEQWKGSANFFRNTKSKTGYESKCRTCRRAAKAA